MPAPVYAPAYNARIKFGANYLTATTAQLRTTLGTFDTDNTEGGIFSEFGIDKVTIELTCTVAVSDLNAANIPKLGASATVEWQETMTGGVTHSGSGQITELTKNGGGRGGYTFNMTIRFIGEVTNLLDASIYTPPEEP